MNRAPRVHTYPGHVSQFDLVTEKIKWKIDSIVSFAMNKNTLVTASAKQVKFPPTKTPSTAARPSQPPRAYSIHSLEATDLRRTVRRHIRSESPFAGRRTVNACQLPKHPVNFGTVQRNALTIIMKSVKDCVLKFIDLLADSSFGKSRRGYLDFTQFEQMLIESVGGELTQSKDPATYRGNLVTYMHGKEQEMKMNADQRVFAEALKNKILAHKAD